MRHTPEDRLIIGVVGPTKTPTAAALRFAGDVGRLIALSGEVVVSGGHHGASQEAAKNVVLRAAVDTGAPLHGLGILPEAGQPFRESGLEYLRTGMKSKRNALTGGLPDVIIAVQGGAGTLSEIFFALHYQRPVVFIDWEVEDFERACSGYLDAVTTLVNAPSELDLFNGDVERKVISRRLRDARKVAQSHSSAKGALADARSATPGRRDELLTALANSTSEWQTVGGQITKALHAAAE